MPLYGAIALVAALVFVSLTLVAPGWWRIIPGLLLVASLVAAFVAFAFRAQLPFFWIIVRGRFIEPRRVTSEVRTRL